ncbi:MULTISPECIES: hypothetical protein [unclassified Campylobacter]|uniref:hypothetical protein n=1 Tax=unclassified Campylobacter TaxID=2593542 RepID=UPI00163C52BA|nr:MULTISPECIES: hypothetical protein [unclassified Campylobacter]
MQKQLLELIKQNGNLIAKDDLVVFEDELKIDEKSLEQNLQALINDNKISPVWINPLTQKVVDKKDIDHYEFGYSVVYPKVNYDIFFQ